jgi:hypothetical protein
LNITNANRSARHGNKSLNYGLKLSNIALPILASKLYKGIRTYFAGRPEQLSD